MAMFPKWNINICAFLYHIGNEFVLTSSFLIWYNNNTEAGTLDFSGVPAFLVTNVLKVHCSNPNYKGFR